MSHHISKYALLALLPALAAAPALAEDAYANTLTGDWNGYRTKLEDAGISTELSYKAHIFNNLSGGLKEGTRALDNLDVIATFDGEKIVGAKGLSATIHLLNNNGGRPDGDLVGSAQGIDNIEVPRATGKLFQAFVQQNLFDDKLSILAGLYALDSEFYITDSSGLFLHSTFGIGTDIAQSGVNGPTIFPFSSVGTRIRVNPTDTTYVQAAILDGVPGDTDHLSGTHINFNENDGLLIVGEAGYTPEGSKIAIGSWYYTEKAQHQIDVDADGLPLKEHNQGIYVIGETKLYKETDDQGLSGFARFGFANADINQFDYAWSTGLVYTGAFPTRDEGQLGFGITGAHNGNDYLRTQAASATPTDKRETSFELTYSDKLLPWLTIQPDAQYVINPSTDSSIDNAFVVGSRLTIDF